MGEYADYFVDNVEKNKPRHYQHELTKSKRSEKSNKQTESSYQLEKPIKENHSKPVKSEASEMLYHSKRQESFRLSDLAAKAGPKTNRDDNAHSYGVNIHVSRPGTRESFDSTGLDTKKTEPFWEHTTPEVVIKNRSHSHQFDSNYAGMNRLSKIQGAGNSKSISDINTLFSSGLQAVANSIESKEPQSKGEFIEDVGNYITYFEKSDSQESAKKGEEAAYLAPSSPKDQIRILQQELNVYVCENKKLQAQIDYYAEKIHELHAKNKLLTAEVIESRSTIEQLQQVKIFNIGSLTYLQS